LRAIGEQGREAVARSSEQKQARTEAEPWQARKMSIGRKILFWNMVALCVIKFAFSFPAFQLAVLIEGFPNFSRNDVISETNRVRSSLGIGRLGENELLNQAAEQKLKDMAKKEYFAHFSPTGISPWYWIENARYDYTRAGENLAIGFMSAEDTVKAWRESATHRENLLNLNYKDIGVAVGRAKINNVEGILVVQLFGTPAPTPVSLTPTTKSPTVTQVPPKTVKNTPLVTPSQPKIAPKQESVVPIVPKNFQPEVKKGPEVPTENFYVANAPAVFNVIKSTPQTTKVVESVDGIFTFYSLVIFLLSVAAIVMLGAKRELIFRSSVSFATFALAAGLPVVNSFAKSMIF
jgi:hypothetical protein